MISTVFCRWVAEPRRFSRPGAPSAEAEAEEAAAVSQPAVPAAAGAAARPQARGRSLRIGPIR
jgi:hypothetical protein